MLEQTKPITQPKNAKRADGAFGVCAPIPHGKQREGRTMTPIRYKGKVVGVAAWHATLQKVIGAARQKGLKSRKARETNPKARRTVWEAHADADGPGGPYESRYRDDWMNHLPAAFTEVSITDVTAWVIKEGNRLFADTPFKSTWKIYHDALPQWWEKGAHVFMTEHGFADQQWRSNSATNLLVVNYYMNKLMGDSPELMPLDSSLFNDLIEGVALHVVGTTTLPKGERYLMGLTDDAWRTMCEVWSRAPSSERIIEDIDRFKKAVEKIIVAEGSYVEEYDARHGHRKSM